ncbi:MAG: SDR family NAD(P)-dependent oxidoreductase, partial [Anaerolineaceae bacterium]|nr:SDR family NAD(P)-dependent oxidoreductase [Anaerolineaceae bacterium]
IRAHYNVPRREDLRLSDYNTLAKVINFFKENAGGQSANFPSVVTAPEPTSPLPVPTEHFRGLHFLSANTTAELKEKLQNSLSQAQQGSLPPSQLPEPDQLTLPERLVIDYGSQDEFIKRSEKALKAFDSDNPSMWQAMTAQGVYRGSGVPAKVAFLFPGQGSQYVNMLRELRAIEPVVDAVFVEADRVMEPLLGKPLTHFIYAEGDEASLKEAEQKLKDTTITQPAVLTANVALLRLLEKYGFKPDMVIGHSLGEYAALVAAGVLRFDEALEVVSARGREMVKVSMEDNGCMAAVSAPLKEVERILGSIDEYVVLANINSPLQSVIAGSTKGVDLAIQAFMAANFQAVKIPVSHAFHTKIVAPASEPLRKVIDRMDLQAPKVPVAANVTGDWYPTDHEAILDLLADQVASPVQFIKGATKLYEGGARIFVEVGPKRVLNALTSDIFKDNAEVTLLATNHPRKGALTSFNEALCALFAAGLPASKKDNQVSSVYPPLNVAVSQPAITNGRVPLTGSVVISGAGLGLPGKHGLVFAEDNIQRLLKGEVLIEPIPQKTREHMLDKRVTRLVKHEAGALMVDIDDLEATVKLAGQRGSFDPAKEFGIPEDRVDATDISTQLAIAAGIDALRDAGIPLVMNYRTTSKGTLLPNRWMLPEAMQDETGVIFGSAFPGLERMSEEADHYYTFQNLLSQKQQLLDVIQLLNGSNGQVAETLQNKLEQVEAQLQANDYHFHRHFVFRVLTMGHSQFAEHIGARGPNTSVNAACATTTHAVALAEDWIRAGRCRRVIVIAGDDVTSGNLVNWIGTGLMASGAATIEGNLRMAALPFDRRRNGLIMGMGAAALVVEAEDAVRERGMRGICELLSSQIANSAFHGTRLDVAHVSDVMQRVIAQAEQRFGINRHEIAARTAFFSHETYTPARGGSAAAEIHALRKTFGDQANKVIIANTKGFTGHTMGVGVEDVIAVKTLEFGIVPPIAHYDKDFEPDPDLGDLNLSHGGNYPVQYSLRLGAGFGSQVAMTLLRKVAGVGERVNQGRYQQWLASVSGYQQPELEVVQHNLRVKHEGAPKIKPMVSNWRFGQGPQGWASDAPAPVTAQVNVIPEVKAPEPQPIPQPIQVSDEKPISAPQNDEVARVVLEKVSEKTGYPVEMLDMELDLEADLGIDTVKQAELFASIRENFGIPRREDLRLSDYNTLQKVVQFVLDAQAQQKPVEAVEDEPTDQPESSISNEENASIRRRVPVAVLRPRIDLCTSTGMVLEQGSRVIVIHDTGKVASTLEKKLKEQQVEVLSIHSSNQEELIHQIKEWVAAGSIDGLYYLPTLNKETPFKKMGNEEWHSTLDSKFYNLVTAIRQLPEIKFLVVATRMDGLHGLSANGADNPVSGAAAGFAKAIARERNDILVKIVDFSSKEKPASLANKLVEETLFDPAVMEVGWEADQRFTLVLQDSEIESKQSNPISQGAIFLVSGGTGGITAPIIEDLAQHSQGHFYLLARSRLPEKDHPELELLAKDPEQLKFTILQRLSKSGQKATPAIINQEIAALERAAATLKTMEVIHKSGGQATYLPCDVSDQNTVNEVVKQIIQKEGRVDVLIHAAGVEKSRKLDSKSDEEFRQIINVKATGFFNLFKALENENQLPKAIVNFSSVAGRFGNTGQTDYSAANDLLCRLTSTFRQQYPEIQVVTIDWGAWAEVGMASRGHIPELMKRAGIDMIHPQQAAVCVRHELEAGSRGEVVLAGSLGLFETQKDPDGGLDIEKANIALTSGQPIHV